MECLLQVHDLWRDDHHPHHHNPRHPEQDLAPAPGPGLALVTTRCVWLEEGLRGDPLLGVALLAAVQGLVASPAVVQARELVEATIAGASLGEIPYYVYPIFTIQPYTTPLPSLFYSLLISITLMFIHPYDHRLPLILLYYSLNPQILIIHSLDVRGPVLAEVLQSLLGSSRDSSSSGSGSSSSSGSGSSSSSSSGIGSGSTGVASGYMVSVLCRLLMEYDRDVNKGSTNGSDKGATNDSTNDSTKGSDSLLGQYLDTTLSRLQVDPVKHTNKFLTGQLVVLTASYFKVNACWSLLLGDDESSDCITRTVILIYLI